MALCVIEQVRIHTIKYKYNGFIQISITAKFLMLPRNMLILMMTFLYIFMFFYSNTSENYKNKFLHVNHLSQFSKGSCGIDENSRGFNRIP